MPEEVALPGMVTRHSKVGLAVSAFASHAYPVYVSPLPCLPFGFSARRRLFPSL